eukprot:SAG31_NODE_1664_length_7585_cov_10.994523_5_plen_127_part_00
MKSLLSGNHSLVTQSTSALLPHDSALVDVLKARCILCLLSGCRGDQQLKKHGKPFLAGTASATIADFRFCVQFTDSIYNDLPSSVLGDEMKDKVKALIDTKPVFKKYILEIILPAIKDVRTEDMMW